MTDKDGGRETGPRFTLPAQVRYGKSASLLGSLFDNHADHVITVRAPAYRVGGTGPTAGYLFCRDCDGDVALNAAPHVPSDRRHEWWQDTCYCRCVRCDEQGDHFGGNERPDAWDRLREATIAAKAAWCHCSCDPCVSRGEHHPADCPAPECPGTGPTDMGR